MRTYKTHKEFLPDGVTMTTVHCFNDGESLADFIKIVENGMKEADLYPELPKDLKYLLIDKGAEHLDALIYNCHHADDISTGSNSGYLIISTNKGGWILDHMDGHWGSFSDFTQV